MMKLQSSNYDNILLLEDFNSEPTKETKENFCQIHNLKNLITNLLQKSWKSYHDWPFLYK